jgi:hypothetical protein
MFYHIYVGARNFGAGRTAFPVGGIATYLCINLLTIYALLTGGELPSHTPSVMIFIIILFFGSIPFWSKKRVFQILRKYRKESDKFRKIGSIVVWSYTILTFVSAFLVFWHYKTFL